MAQIKIGKFILDLADTPAAHDALLAATGVSPGEMSAILAQGINRGRIADCLLAFGRPDQDRETLIDLLRGIEISADWYPMLAQLRAFLDQAAQPITPSMPIPQSIQEEPSA